MRPIEIISVIASAIIVVGVIIKSVIRKKQGKNCCGECSSCGYSCKKTRR